MLKANVKCPIYLCLHQRGLITINVNKIIAATLGSDAIGYFTVAKHLREAQIRNDSEPIQISIEEKGHKFTEGPILMALLGDPFASVGRIVSRTLISMKAVHPHVFARLT
jgi:hypothetical protein